MYILYTLPIHKWPHGNSCTWAYDIRLHIAGSNEPGGRVVCLFDYIYIYYIYCVYYTNSNMLICHACIHWVEIFFRTRNAKLITTTNTLNIKKMDKPAI